MRRSRRAIFLSPATPVTIGASVTAKVISAGQDGDGFALYGGLSGRIDIGLGATTKTTGITFTFQSAACKDSTGAWMWQDVATAVVPATAAGETALTIFWNPWISGAVAGKLPTGLVGRVHVTTGASDSVIVNSLSLTECP